jgi:hypothetical protein
MNSHASIEEMRVQLNFVGFAREPNDVTALVGITPSKVWRTGDVIERSNRTYESNGWRVSAERSITEIEAGVDALFARLAPQWETLRQFSHESRVELSIVIYAGQQVPAVHLRRDQLDRLTELGGSVDVDVYCLGGDDE